MLYFRPWDWCEQTHQTYGPLESHRVLPIQRSSRHNGQVDWLLWRSWFCCVRCSGRRPFCDMGTMNWTTSPDACLRTSEIPWDSPMSCFFYVAALHWFVVRTTQVTVVGPHLFERCASVTGTLPDAAASQYLAWWGPRFSRQMAQCELLKCDQSLAISLGHSAWCAGPA